MILIGLGANLPGLKGESPKETLFQALAMFPEKGLKVVRRSPFYATEPVPPSGQAWYVNAVANIETSLEPEAVLAALLEIEAALGRTRGAKNEARIIDLDLIDYDGRVLPSPEAWQEASENDLSKGFFAPHLRAHERRFVLAPLIDVAADWRHPVLGLDAATLLARLPASGRIAKLDD